MRPSIQKRSLRFLKKCAFAFISSFVLIFIYQTLLNYLGIDIWSLFKGLGENARLIAGSIIVFAAGMGIANTSKDILSSRRGIYTKNHIFIISLFMIAGSTAAIFIPSFRNFSSLIGFGFVIMIEILGSSIYVYLISKDQNKSI